jgi:GPI mannosyltransferase 2
MSFVWSAVTLYHLSRSLNFTPIQARNASILFCIQPASIFMSSFYTESLFALTTLYGMWKFSEGSMFLASLAFGSASLIRANGVLYAGFFIWHLLHQRSDAVTHIFTTFKMGSFLFITLAPFLWFQFTGFASFCVSDNPPNWCLSSLPSIYAHVQSHYWGNGFMKYYTLNNIPNFVLALPSFVLITSALLSYFNHSRIRFLTLGFVTGNGTHGLNSDSILPFMYLNLFMLIILATTMHVQIITRFYSSSPIIYWFLASELSKVPEKRNKIAYWYVIYSMGYGTILTSLFANFLPPA